MQQSLVGQKLQESESRWAQRIEILQAEANLPFSLATEIKKSLALTSSYHVALREILSDSETTGALSVWNGFTAGGAGELYRGLIELGEDFILSEFVKSTPNLTDRLAEGVLTGSAAGVWEHVLGFLGQDKRYEALFHMYCQAIEASPALAEQLAQFSPEHFSESTADYSRFLVSGILRPIVTVGHALPLQNNSIVRGLGDLLDRVNGESVSPELAALTIPPLESKEIAFIEQIVEFARVCHEARSIEIQTPQVQLSAESLSRAHLPSGFVFIPTPDRVETIDRGLRAQVISNEYSVLATAVHNEGVLVSSAAGLFNCQISGESLQFGYPVLNSHNPEVQPFPAPQALSPSGRFYIGIDNYLWMHREAAKRAQSEDPSFQLVGMLEGPDNYYVHPFEPSEGTRGSAKREAILPEFSWRVCEHEEYAVVAARDLPTLYVKHFEPGQQHATTTIFDLTEYMYDHQRREDRRRVAWAELSPSGRWLAAISKTESEFPVLQIFDRKLVSASDAGRRQNPIHTDYFHAALPWNTNSQPAYAFFTSDQRLLVFDENNHVLGQLEQYVNRRGYSEWKVARTELDLCTSSRDNLVLAPGGHLIAVLEDSGQDVAFRDSTSLKVSSRIRIASEGETITSLRYSPTGYQLLLGDSRGGVWEIAVEPPSVTN